MFNATQLIEQSIWNWADFVLNRLYDDITTDAPAYILFSGDLVSGDAVTVVVDGQTVTKSFATSSDATMQTIISTLTNQTNNVSAEAITKVIDVQGTTKIRAIKINGHGSKTTSLRIKASITHSTGKANVSVSDRPETPIIWMHQKGATPDELYITLHTAGSVEKGIKYRSPFIITDPDTDPDEGAQYLMWPEEVTVSVQSWGVGSDELLERLRRTADLSSVMAFLDSEYLSLVDATSIKDASAILDMMAESRSVFEVKFYTGLMMENIGVGYIKTATVEPATNGL